MSNMTLNIFSKQFILWKKRSFVPPLLATISGLILYLYGIEAFALSDQDKVAEIATLTTEVTKLAKNGCYITGCASALIGAVFAVAQQSLKIFGVAAGVTLLAFKAPTFFTTAMLI